MLLLIATGFCVGMVVVLGAEPVLSRQSLNGKTTYDNINNRDLSAGDRAKRAATTMIGAFLKSARLVFSNAFYREYKKFGGTRQARKDFRGLGMRNVKNQGDSQWGTIANRYVIMQKTPTGSDIYVLDRTVDNKVVEPVLHKIQYKDVIGYD